MPILLLTMPILDDLQLFRDFLDFISSSTSDGALIIPSQAGA
jgi:hypothetical protein